MQMNPRYYSPLLFTLTTDTMLLFSLRGGLAFGGQCTMVTSTYSDIEFAGVNEHISRKAGSLRCMDVLRVCMEAVPYVEKKSSNEPPESSDLEEGLTIPT